jgi:hypothetical protein
MFLEAARNWWDSETKRIVSKSYTVYDYNGVEFNLWNDSGSQGLKNPHPLLEHSKAIKRCEISQLEKRLFPNHRFSWVPDRILSQKETDL